MMATTLEDFTSARALAGDAAALARVTSGGATDEVVDVEVDVVDDVLVVDVGAVVVVLVDVVDVDVDVVVGATVVVVVVVVVVLVVVVVVVVVGVVVVGVDVVRRVTTALCVVTPA